MAVIGSSPQRIRAGTAAGGRRDNRADRGNYNGPVNEKFPFTVALTEWESARDSLRAVRHAVFVQEQRVPEELEWDGEDGRCHHVIARAADGSPVGTGRLLPDGHIGRMAVLRAWRGRGVGSALMQSLLNLAAGAGHSRVVLNAQTHAVGFYARHGFAVSGEEFMDAGIPHVAMQRDLEP